MGDTPEIPPPYALSLGICDLVYRDRGTGKRFILGCFSVLHAVEFPAIHPGLGIYLDLTNGRGANTVKIQIVDTEQENDPLWEAEAEIDFADPRMIAELDFMVGGLSFPKPGEYRVQVYASDRFIVERRLLVNQLER